MKAVSLLYHDAVVDGDLEASGFNDAGAELYKLDLDELKAHFNAIASARTEPPVLVTDILEGTNQDSRPWLLTFDDGGVSAALHISDLLDEFGWKAHFLVTAGRIGTSGFVDRGQVRELAARGHLIGSHSWSHPDIMSDMSRQELMEEWGRSAESLAEITGEATVVASIPRGNFSQTVAETAFESGIRALFTSEPQKTVHRVSGSLILGRYTLLRGDPSAVAAGLVSAKATGSQARQYLWWNAKKAVKRAGGGAYLTLREKLLSLRNRR